MVTHAETVERSFPVGEAAELVLSGISGDVQIVGWDRPQIWILATKRPGGTWSSEEGFRSTRIDMQQDGARVSVRTRKDATSLRGFLSWLGGMARVDYTIRVPRRSRVVADLISGSLQISNIQGSIIARTFSGSQTLRQVIGHLVASTVSGDLQAENINGKAVFKSVSGNIDATRSHFSSLACRTVSAGIDVGSPLDQAGSYDFKTVSGAVTLRVPPSTSCTLDLQSISGVLASDLPATIEQVGRGHWQATVNGGGVWIKALSVSGEFRLMPVSSGVIAAMSQPVCVSTESPDALVQPEEAPTPQSTTGEPLTPNEAAARSEPTGAVASDAEEASMMEILRAVERGDLTVEQAAAMLADLEGPAPLD